MVSRIKSLITNTAEMFREPRFMCARSGKRFAFSQQIENMICSKRLVYFGEHHEQPEVLQVELALLQALVNHVSNVETASVRVFLEHFSLEQQNLLDKFMQNKRMEISELQQEYDDSGDESFSLEKYSPILEFARAESEKVKLVASFVPRRFASDLVNQGEEIAHKQLSDIDETLAAYVKNHYQPGSDNHYNFFESLISGRSLNSNVEDNHVEQPSDRFRKIFPAQVFKDSVMAGIVAKHLHQPDTKDDKFLVICGAGHSDYGFGVPERLEAVIDKENTCSITVRDAIDYQIEKPEILRDALIVENFGPKNKYPSDLVFLYHEEVTEEDAEYDKEDVEAGIKLEMAEAYDKVADTANRKGNLALAEAVMLSLGYKSSQIEIAGQDAYNFQGVGNPHRHANLEEGDIVLDIGSGLGVDSFIAAAEVGEKGKVFGLDISKGEVRHATKRAEKRDLDSKNIEFIHADMEKIPLPDSSVDCVISNGAFCLAPNKRKSFEEIKRVLKSGGRFSVACTTLLENLDKNINWPICMQVFMPLKEANPLLIDLGFSDVEIDMSDSKMVVELEFPEDHQRLQPALTCNDQVENSDISPPHTNNYDSLIEQTPSSERKRVHVGSKEFEHLKNFDMNKLCARVVFHGKKP